MELPLYLITVQEDLESDSGFSFTSLVNDPATKEHYLAFSDKEFEYSFNEEQRIVTGPAVVVGKPIFRKEPHPCHVVFDKENTAKLVKKYARQEKFNSVNLEHEKEATGIFMFQSVIADRENGFSPPKSFDHVPDGSWFLSYLVDNDEVWEQVKNKTFNGFSMQGKFGLAEPDNVLRAFADELNKFCATLKDVTYFK